MHVNRFLIFLWVLAVAIAAAAPASLAGEFVDAAKKGDFQAVNKMLQGDSTLVGDTDERGYTALHWSSVRGHWTIMSLLVRNGASVNAVGADGGTPLHWACHHDEPGRIRELLDAGADLGIQNQWGRAPLHVASRRGCVEVASLLIERGADVNVVTSEGWTPLHVAYKSGQPGIVSLLVQAGADTERLDSEGNRPIDVARLRPAEVPIEPDALEEYIGIYELGPGFGLKIWREGDVLHIREFAPDELYSTGKDEFFCRQEPWRVVFERDDDGIISAVEVDFIRQTVRGEKKPHALYVGSEVCKDCHLDRDTGNQYVAWLSSRHAAAYWRLATDWALFLARLRPHNYDLEVPFEDDRCLMCHTTGAQNAEALFAGGFRVEEGIGCETCHGPGSVYIDPEVMSDRKAFLAAGGVVPTEETCRTCHRNDRFDFEEWWPKIAHPRKTD